jgi:general stress protein YciG
MSDTIVNKPRGFASLTPERRKEIASRAGKRAHELGKAHKFTSDEARAAGQKGGVIIGQDPKHMAIIGRAGGLMSAERRKRKPVS